MNNTQPTVLAIAGHDPGGGAGIQADIESITANGCHACTVITTLTIQDSRDVRRVIPVPAETVIDQIEAVLQDRPVQAVKIGLLGSGTTATAVSRWFTQRGSWPIVLDPILVAGGGTSLSDTELFQTIKTKLFPVACLATPNSGEARLLAGTAPDLDQCACALLELGCGHVLITGTHEPGDTVNNRLYGPSGYRQDLAWPRLPHCYHGSGCTLSAAIAAYLARGFSIPDAVSEAQRFTWQSLRAGYRPGKGQFLPFRIGPGRGHQDP